MSDSANTNGVAAVMADAPSGVSHQLTQRVKLLQKVALLHDGKVLLLKRAQTARSRPGAWDLPGGNSEWPTDGTPSQFGLHAQDAVREVKEETGLVLDATSCTLSALSYCNTFFDASKQVYSVILGWRIELPAGVNPQTVVLSSEHVEFVWAALEELDQFDFGGERGEFVRKIIAGQKS